MTTAVKRRSKGAKPAPTNAADEAAPTRKGPFGAFTDDVIDDYGFVDAKRLAKTLAISVADVARMFQQKPRTLNANPTSASIQAKGTMLLATLNDLATFYQGKKLALRFLRERQPRLDGATLLDLLLEGRLQKVCSLVDDSLTLRPD